MMPSIDSLTVSQRYQLLGKLQQDTLQQEAERLGVSPHDLTHQIRPSMATRVTVANLARSMKLTEIYKAYRLRCETEFLKTFMQDEEVHQASVNWRKMNSIERNAALNHVLDLHLKSYQPGFPSTLIKPAINFFEEGPVVMGRYRMGYAESNLNEPPETYSINLNTKNPEFAKFTEAVAYAVHEQTHLVMEQLAYTALHNEIPHDSPLLEEGHNILACEQAHAWPDTRIVPEVYEEFCYERDAINAESAVRECAQKIKARHRWDFLGNGFHAVAGLIHHRAASQDITPEL